MIGIEKRPESAFAASLGAMPGPMVLVDAEMRVQQPSCDLPPSTDGWVWVRQGRLQLACQQVQRRLEQAVRAACACKSRSTQRRARAPALTRGTRPPLVLTVYPNGNRPPAAAEAPEACLAVRDPEHLTVDVGLLQDLFQLTPAEATVVAAVAEGTAAEHIAAQQGIRRATVNAHLKKALAKTGTGRQAALVALVLRCATRLDAMRSLRTLD